MTTFAIISVGFVAMAVAFDVLSNQLDNIHTYVTSVQERVGRKMENLKTQLVALATVVSTLIESVDAQTSVKAQPVPVQSKQANPAKLKKFARVVFNESGCVIAIRACISDTNKPTYLDSTMWRHGIRNCELIGRIYLKGQEYWLVVGQCGKNGTTLAVKINAHNTIRKSRVYRVNTNNFDKCVWSPDDYMHDVVDTRPQTELNTTRVKKAAPASPVKITQPVKPVQTQTNNNTTRVKAATVPSIDFKSIVLKGNPTFRANTNIVILVKNTDGRTQVVRDRDNRIIWCSPNSKNGQAVLTGKKWADKGSPVQTTIADLARSMQSNHIA